MDLSLTGEQEALQHSIRSMLEDKFPTSAARACELDPGNASGIYHELFKMGIGGILVDEDAGGLSLGLTDLAVTQVELGRALVPMLFAETTVFATKLLSGSQDEAARNILASIASGSATASCAWQEADRNGIGSVPNTLLTEGEGGLRVSGEKMFVPEAGLADYLLVHARDSNGDVALCIVERTAPGITITDLPNLADLAMATIRFENAPVLALAGKGKSVTNSSEEALSAMQLAVAAQAVGGTERILEITREYASTRTQFGQPIGGFQAIAHMLAEAAVNLEGARLLVYRAAAAADEGESWISWAGMAKLKACQAYRDISAIAIQIHGGIGFTLEADPQLFYRRAKHLQLMYGEPLDLQERIGDALIAGSHRVLEA